MPASTTWTLIAAVVTLVVARLGYAWSRRHDPMSDDDQERRQWVTQHYAERKARKH